MNEMGDGEPGSPVEDMGPVDWSTWLSGHLAQSSTKAPGTPETYVPAERVQLEPVAGRMSFPEPELTAELRSVQEALEGFPPPQDPPVAPDQELVGGIRPLVETLNTPSAGSSSQVLDGLSELRQAVVRLPTGIDPEVTAALQALRMVVDRLVDVVAEFPSALRQVLNARLDEHDEVLVHSFKNVTLDIEELQHNDRSLRLDEAQIRAIVSAVVEATSREGPTTTYTPRSDETRASDEVSATLGEAVDYER